MAPPSKPGVEHSAELVNVVFKETLGEAVAARRYIVQGYGTSPCPPAHVSMLTPN